MNLILILIGIYVAIYLYNRYYNYSIKDVNNIEISKSYNIHAIEKKSDTIVTENNCKNGDLLIKKYIEFNKDNHDNRNNQYNQDNQLNIKSTEISSQINNLYYVDGLIKNVNLDINIPDTDNSNCTDTVNQTNKKNMQKTKQFIKNKNFIDLYLMANSEGENKEN